MPRSARIFLGICFTIILLLSPNLFGVYDQRFADHRLRVAAEEIVGLAEAGPGFIHELRARYGLRVSMEAKEALRAELSGLAGCAPRGDGAIRWGPRRMIGRRQYTYPRQGSFIFDCEGGRAITLILEGRVDTPIFEPRVRLEALSTLE